jgi:HSP20 family protein
MTMSRFSYQLPTRNSLRQAVAELDKLFNSMSNDVASVLPKFLTPKVNIYRKDGKYIFDFYVPFVKKEDVEINIEEGSVLNVHVKANQIEDLKDDDYIYREISRGQATRKIDLGEDVDIDSIQAVLKDGILTLTFDPIKPKEPEVKKVNIR